MASRRKELKAALRGAGWALRERAEGLLRDAPPQTAAARAIVPTPRVCIVAMYLYPLFRPECLSPYGGSEFRMAVIARELARRERFDVHAVVWDHDQPEAERLDGVTFHFRPGEKPIEPKRPPAPRFRGNFAQRVGRRLVRTGRRWRAQVNDVIRAEGHVGPYIVDRARLNIYDRIGADLWVVPGNTLLAAEVALYCRRRAKPFILVGGSDADFDRGFAERPYEVGVYGSPGYVQRSTIAAADLHLVQTRHQADLLREHFHRGAIQVDNPIALERKFPRAAEPDILLWVGKSDWIKRPELALEIARAHPGQKMVMVMSLSNPEIHTRIAAEAKAANVELVGYVPITEIESYFARAKVFINTSRFEGFPNTFLQAAKYEVPIVSLVVDPGRMLSEQGAGVAAEGDLARASAAVGRFAEQPAERAAVGARALAYVTERHDVARAVDTVEVAFTRVLEEGRLP
jgi:glycosyltransferase involved in cell wall biosynthesis